jgi:RNA polymerase sigma factor (sigma-70 family)
MRRPDREIEWARLLRAANSGDQDAYRKFLRSMADFLKPVVARHGARIGLGRDDTEDSVQEILLAIHLKKHTWDEDRPIGPWVIAIARHKLIDARRRTKNFAVVPIEDVAEKLPAAPAAEALAAEDLDKLLVQLNSRQQDLVRSLSLQGRSIKETAQRLNMNEGAVRVALHRAINALGALTRKNDR